MPETKRILIVDDEPGVVAYLEMLLKDHGYETLSARNGDEGLRMARSDRPDLITLDISMPETSGVRCYKELKNDPDLSSTPVIIVTAVTGYAGDPYGYMKFMSEKIKLPEPEGFFPKPIDKQEFVERVQSILSHQSTAAG
jgi:CheY-like chemotaxis protein